MLSSGYIDKVHSTMPTEGGGESTGKAALNLNLGGTGRWVNNATPRPLYPQEGNPVPVG